MPCARFVHKEGVDTMTKPTSSCPLLSADEASRAAHRAYVRHEARRREIAEAEARLSRWFWEDDEDEEEDDDHEA